MNRRREKLPPLDLTRADAGDTRTIEAKRKEAVAFILAARKQLEPRFLGMVNDARKWQKEEEKRKREEKEARLLALRSDVWLTREVYVQLWVSFLEELLMEYSMPAEEVFKPNRFKITTPRHPSEPPNEKQKDRAHPYAAQDAELFVEAKTVIEDMIDSPRSDKYEEVISELYQKAVARTKEGQKQLRDTMEYRAANDA